MAPPGGLGNLVALLICARGEKWQVDFKPGTSAWSIISQDREEAPGLKECESHGGRRGILEHCRSSGCGKTTFLNIVDGLLQSTQGQIFLDGRPVNNQGMIEGWYFKAGP